MGILARVGRHSQLREVTRLSPEVMRLRSALLRETDLFHGIAQDEVDAIAGKLPMATCKRGQIVYAPGETGEALFMLKAGSVRLYRLAPDGRKLVLATMGPGSVFGEMRSLGQSMTGSFAEAASDATVCIMSGIDVDEYLLAHPSVALRMVRLLAERLGTAEDRLEQLAFQPVPVRVGRLLLTLANERGEVEGFTHQDLAELIGTSRETVSRATMEFKKLGFVDTERRWTRIVDAEGLEAYLGSLS